MGIALKNKSALVFVREDRPIHKYLQVVIRQLRIRYHERLSTAASQETFQLALVI